MLTLVSGAWPTGKQVVIDSNTASKKHLVVGGNVGVQAEGPVEQFRISGIVKFGSASALGGATLAGFDLPTAQALFQKDGRFDEIAVSRKPGATDAGLLKEIRSILPPTAQVRTGTAQAAEDAKQTDSFISFLRGFLLAFGGIALFVGSFVIANSLSITIAQRTREFATMRTLGASRRQVLTSIVIEALVIGILAAVSGLFLGLGLAKGLFKLFDAVGFTLPNSGIVFGTSTIVIALAAGIIVTLVASLRPALRATRVPPIAAVREGATLPFGRFHRFRTLGSDAHDGARLRSSRIRALQASSRHDRRARGDGHRRAADLHRDRDAVRALHPSPGLGARLARDARGRGGRGARTRQCAP